MGESEAGIKTVDNIYNIIVPFYCKEKKNYEKIKAGLQKRGKEVEQASFENNYLLGYIKALYNNTKVLNIKCPDDENKMQLVLFETGIGFIILKYNYKNKINIEEQKKQIEEQKKQIDEVENSIKNGKNSLMEDIANIIDCADLSPSSEERKVLKLEFLILKVDERNNCSHSLKMRRYIKSMIYIKCIVKLANIF